MTHLCLLERCAGMRISTRSCSLLCRHEHDTLSHADHLTSLYLTFFYESKEPRIFPAICLIESEETQLVEDLETTITKPLLSKKCQRPRCLLMLIARKICLASYENVPFHSSVDWPCTYSHKIGVTQPGKARWKVLNEKCDLNIYKWATTLFVLFHELFENLKRLSSKEVNALQTFQVGKTGLHICGFHYQFAISWGDFS